MKETLLFEELETMEEYGAASDFAHGFVDGVCDGAKAVGAAVAAVGAVVAT